MRSDIKDLGDLELLRKHKIVTEYLSAIVSEINTRKLKERCVKNNFPQHLSSNEIEEEDSAKKNNSFKITVKEKNGEKNSERENDKNSKLESLTKNDLKLALDENKISYKANIKKEELIELIRKNHFVRQTLKLYNKNLIK